MRKLKLAVLFALRALGAFSVARMLTRRHLRILCYHGFELRDEVSFRPQLFIRAATFERRLESVRRLGFDVISLDAAVQRLEHGTLTGDELVITADDGFHSFARDALPALSRSGYPSTVYVTSYYVAHEAPVFCLAVQYMFWKTQRKTMIISGAAWSADRSLDLSDAQAVERAVCECIDYGEQHCNQSQREDICIALGQMLDVSYQELVDLRLFHLMTPNELRELAQHRVSVELHTHRHRFPPDNVQACRDEINDNRRALQGWTGRKPEHFCYPSGVWNMRQWDWLNELGVKSSTTCEAGVNPVGTPKHAIKRILDGQHVHQLEFEASISGFITIAQSLTRRLGRQDEIKSVVNTK